MESDPADNFVWVCDPGKGFRGMVGVRELSPNLGDGRGQAVWKDLATEGVPASDPQVSPAFPWQFTIDVLIRQFAVTREDNL